VARAALLDGARVVALLPPEPGVWHARGMVRELPRSTVLRPQLRAPRPECPSCPPFPQVGMLIRGPANLTYWQLMGRVGFALDGNPARRGEKGEND